MTVLLSAELHITLPNTSTLLSESEIGDKYMQFTGLPPLWMYTT